MFDKFGFPKTTITITETTWEEIVRQVLDGEIKNFEFLKFDEEGRILNKEILD